MSIEENNDDFKDNSIDINNDRNKINNEYSDKKSHIF